MKRAIQASDEKRVRELVRTIASKPYDGSVPSPRANAANDLFVWLAITFGICCHCGDERTASHRCAVMIELEQYLAAAKVSA